MRIHGKYYFGYRLRALSNRTLLCACLVACLIVGGCRSSRSVVQETGTIEHNEFSTTENIESVLGAASDSIYQRDSIKGNSGERGRIDIERDTAGRPVVIRWNVNSNFSTKASTETLKKDFFTLRGLSNNTEASGSVDSVTQKKEEITKDVKVGIPLEYLVCCCIVILLLLFFIGDDIYKLWKRKE